MKISVILPALNEVENIERAIQSVLNAGADEVIVVDGGSTDETCRAAKRLNCRVLESQAGRGNQQHHGAKVASGDVLLFLHADSFLANDSIHQIRLAFSRRGSCKFGAFRQRINATGFGFRWLELCNLARIRLLRLPYGDQGIFIRRDFYFEIGGFPPIPLMEDVALSLNARKRTRPIVLSGPIFVHARRWSSGIIRQTLFNWSLCWAYLRGASPEKLADYYERNDKKVRKWRDFT